MSTLRTTSTGREGPQTKSAGKKENVVKKEKVVHSKVCALFMGAGVSLITSAQSLSLKRSLLKHISCNVRGPRRRASDVPNQNMSRPTFGFVQSTRSRRRICLHCLSIQMIPTSAARALPKSYNSAGFGKSSTAKRMLSTPFIAPNIVKYKTLCHWSYQSLIMSTKMIQMVCDSLECYHRH